MLDSNSCDVVNVSSMTRTEVQHLYITSTVYETEHAASSKRLTVFTTNTGTGITATPNFTSTIVSVNSIDHQSCQVHLVMNLMLAVIIVSSASLNVVLCICVYLVKRKPHKEFVHG